MRLRTRYIILAILFLTYFGVRIFFSLQSQNFSDDSSYFALRQIDNIAETAKPIIQDDLSYGGRRFSFMPFYYYLLAFFTLLFPKILIIKIINNFFASTLILAVYLICSKLIKNRRIVLICSIVSATFPVYLKETVNSISTSSIIIPGGFFLLYFFLKLDNKNIVNYLIPLTIVLVLSSSSSFLILLGLLIYIILINIENMSMERIELEYIAFFLLFFLWANFIIFKNAFQLHGFTIIWQNTPSRVLNEYFVSINLLDALTSLGLLLFVIGIYTVYNYIVRKKSKNLLIFISVFLATFILFWAKLVQSELALIFLGATLAILFGQSLRELFATIKKSKLAKYINTIYFLLIILIIISQVAPGISIILDSSKSTFTNEYIAGFKWLKQNTPKDVVILAIPEEGHLITYFGQRKNIMDTDFLLVEDAETRIKEIESFYRQKFKIEAIQILEKYNADYVVFSDKAKIKYKVSKISFIDDPCFELVYDLDIKIYKWNKELCELKSI